MLPYVVTVAKHTARSQAVMACVTCYSWAGLQICLDMTSAGQRRKFDVSPMTQLSYA